MAYTKQNFQDGQILYASNLVSIEDAIVADEAVDTGLASRISDLETAVGSGGSVSQQIASAVNNIDNQDAAVANQYISQVGVSNGKLSVTRASIPVTSVNGLTGDVFIGSDGTVAGTMQGATASANGASGVVPAPQAGDQNKFLRGDATWQNVDAGVTGVKGNKESSYRTGNVNLTPANLGAAEETHTHSGADITSGTIDASYIGALPASKITSGTLASARIPSATTSAKGGVKIGAGLSVASGVVSADVRSVNGRTGNVSLTIPTKVSDLDNDSGFLTSAPVTSVNSQTGDVNLTIPTKTSDLTNDSGFLTSAPVTSVNGQTGNVTISVPTKTSDLTNDSGFLDSIPTASYSTLGGVKVGSTLMISDTGHLNLNTSSSYTAPSTLHVPSVPDDVRGTLSMPGSTNNYLYWPMMELIWGDQGPMYINSSEYPSQQAQQIELACSMDPNDYAFFLVEYIPYTNPKSKYIRGTAIGGINQEIFLPAAPITSGYRTCKITRSAENKVLVDISAGSNNARTSMVLKVFGVYIPCIKVSFHPSTVNTIPKMWNTTTPA